MPPELVTLDPRLRRLANASEAELLRAVAAGGGEGQTAQAEFYSRHVHYLYAVLVKQQHRLRRVVGISAEDLVQDTFHRAFSRAHTFSANAIDDPEHLRRRTRAWLGRIAQNLLIDAVRQSREISDSASLEQLEAQAPPSSRPSPDSARATGDLRPSERMTLAFQRLSEREQDVLRVSALYYRAGDDHQRLPNDVSQELARRWQTTNENIRAIRSRALKKLKSWVEETRPEAQGAPSP
ncbi:MAG: sigma-70 family RNA polymerase sigma factor [Myxococcales bacterium]|nr:sigma-70 family RNA polymerase sigma factor [Myxococcales bacterium]